MRVDDVAGYLCQTLVFGFHPHGILILSRIMCYGGVWEVLVLGVGPGRHCSPRHRMPVNSRNGGSKCEILVHDGAGNICPALPGGAVPRAGRVADVQAARVPRDLPVVGGGGRRAQDGHQGAQGGEARVASHCLLIVSLYKFAASSAHNHLPACSYYTCTQSPPRRPGII